MLPMDCHGQLVTRIGTSAARGRRGEEEVCTELFSTELYNNRVVVSLTLRLMKQCLPDKLIRQAFVAGRKKVSTTPCACLAFGEGARQPNVHVTLSAECVCCFVNVLCPACTDKSL
jgi:hypothetical protein